MSVDIFVPAEIFLLAEIFEPAANFVLAKKFVPAANIVSAAIFVLAGTFVSIVCSAALRPQVINFGHGETVRSPYHIFPGEN